MLDHRDQRRVVKIGVTRARDHAGRRGGKERRDVHLKAQRRHQKVRAGKALDREGVAGKGVIRRQHGHQLVHMQREPVQPLHQCRLIADEGAVKRLVLDAVIHLLDAAGGYRGVRLRELPQEIGQDRGQPLARNARIRADADRGGALVAQEGDAALQRVGGGDIALHPDKQALARAGELHAALAADQQIDPQLALQRIHHLRQPRLGIAELRRRGRQTTGFYCCEKGFDLFAFHVNYFTFL